MRKPGTEELAAQAVWLRLLSRCNRAPARRPVRRGPAAGSVRVGRGQLSELLGPLPGRRSLIEIQGKFAGLRAAVSNRSSKLPVRSGRCVLGNRLFLRRKRRELKGVG